MAVLKNRAKMSTSTTGTGTITLGSAESGYQTFADAGVANADVVRYVIEDGNNWEIGTGTYTATGTTLSRTVSESSNADAAINLSGSATVFIGATAEDIQNFVASTSTATAPNDSVSIAIGGQAVASGTNSISLQRANSSGTDSIAAVVGNTTSSYGAQGLGSISIGTLSKATALAGTAVGYGATSTHAAASAFGTSATTTATNQIALGGSGITARISGAYNLPTSDGTNGQVLTTDGSGNVNFAAAGGDPDLYRDNAVNATTPTAAGDNAFAIGSGAISAGNNSAALGNSRAGAASSIAGAINNNSSSYGTTGVNTVSFGTQSRATNNSAVSIGQSSIGSGYQSAAYGYNAVASGQDSFAGGPTTDATATNSTALGKNAQATHANATAVGYNAATSATNQVSLGALGYAVRISSAYTLPTSDGSANQVLTAAGDGTTSWAAAGGGGAALYAANESSPSAQPSATGANAVAIGDSAVASGQESVAFSKSLASGRQSFAAALSSNSASYGAQGYHSVALGERSKATGYASVALGFGTATADNSFACSTSNSGYASAINSFAFGANAQAAGSPSIAMGYQPEAKAEASVAMGYRTKITNYGSGSAAFGIDAYIATGSKMVLGGRQFSSNGDCQTGTTVLKGATTDATALQLASGYAGSSPDISNQIVLPNNSAFAFHGTIVARQQAAGGTACAAWKVEGLIRREGSAGTTVLVNSATTVLDNTPSWGMALSADTTNGCLKVQVTGAAATNIRWVATIHTSEVTYA